MAKRTRLFPRGYPDRRGMGAPSDSISEQFVPTETYKAQQKEMSQKLLAAGWTAEQVERLFPAAADIDPLAPPSEALPSTNEPEDQ